MVVGTFFQHSNARVIAVSCFVLTATLHGAIAQFPFMDSGFYYVSAGMFNLLTVYILFKINHVTRLITDLQTICAVAFGLNIYGYVIYMAYLPTDSYQELFPVVYWLALIALLRKDEGDAVGGNDKSGFLGGNLRFLFDRAARVQLLAKDGGKI